MSPFSKLIRRIDRTLILLMMASHGHTSAVALERMRRHALVNYFILVIGDLDFARELDVVVLFQS